MLPPLFLQALHAGAGATGASRAVILGDDSLLIKYLNPHLIALGERRGGRH